MIIRILALISILSISFMPNVFAITITSEPVPGANCKCIGSDNCTKIQTRKYECETGTSVKIANYQPNKDINNDIARYLMYFIFGGIILYFLPTIIVLFSRNRAHRLSTILINIFLGWSILGWFVALFLSLQSNMIRVEVIEKIIDDKNKSI